MTMNQLYYEIKKVFGQRFFVLITAVLLVICTSLCIFSMRKSTSQLRDEWLVEAYELYNCDPEAARALFLDYEADAMAGIEVPEEYSHLRSVLRKAEINKEYPDKLRKVSLSASRKALELERDGYGEGDFIYDYQKNCESLYLIASEEVTIPVTIVSGWSDYFSQTYTTYFILAAVFLLVCTVYIPEKTDGIYPLLRSTKCGRHALSGAKLGTVILLSLALTVIFSGASFIAIAIKLGFSSPDMPVQVLSGLDYCPYLITVGEYLAIHSLLRLGAVLVFALICAAVTAVRCDYVISFAGGALLVLVNYLLNKANYSSVNAPAKHFNLFSLSDCEGIFSRYYAVDFFGMLVSFLRFGLCFFIPLAIATLVWSFYAIARGRGHLNSVGILSRVIKRIKLPTVTCNTRTKKIRTIRAGLPMFEAQKTIGKLGIIMILILLSVFRINSALSSFGATTDPDEIFYREYMEILDGEYTEEKAKYIRNEMQYILKAIERYEAMNDSEIDLTNEERMAIIEAANYGYSHKNAAERALEYSQRLRELRDLGENDALFLYESGWSLLLGRDADLLAFALILIALCNIFGVEFGKSSSSGRFADILRASKQGRARTFFAKFVLAVACSLTVFIIFEAIDYCLILKSYTLPHAKSASVVLFDKIQTSGIVRFDGVSFADFAITGTLLRILATIFFAIGVFALSVYLKKNISVMLISALILFLPSAISGSSGLTVLSKIDFLPVAAGAELIKISESANPATPFAMPITAIISLLIISTIVIISAHLAWCNPYHKTRMLKNEAYYKQCIKGLRKQ